MGSAVLGFGLLFLFGLVNVLWPRGWWRLAEGWKYRNPDAVAPSDAAIGVQRVAGGFLCLAAIIIPVWGASNEQQAKDEERREEAAAEVKATNREVADRYRQSVVDEAARLATSPRRLPVAVLEPQGVEHLSARRRPDFATTGDVAVYVSAGAGENWCVILPDKPGFPGSVDERPCGYERNIINQFAGEMMARYRTGRTPDLATAKQVASSRSPPLVVLEGRAPRQFTVRLDPIYGGGWCVTFPDSPPGNPTVNEGDCPYRPSSR